MGDGPIGVPNVIDLSCKTGRVATFNGFNILPFFVTTCKIGGDGSCDSGIVCICDVGIPSKLSCRSSRNRGRPRFLCCTSTQVSHLSNETHRRHGLDAKN